ncbi:MAG: DOMON-like domain-containing protein [Nitrospirota bacterium]
MNRHSFSLKPFPSADLLSGIEITGNISRRCNTLEIIYELFGTLAEIVIPAQTDVPERRNGLWEETCLEFFLGVKNSDQYWEFNLSPSGHWNVYRFKAYRRDMHEEHALTSLPFTVLIRPENLMLSLNLDLDKIITADQALNVAVSAVIKSVNGKATYWALTHTGPQADFHRRNSFIIEL